MKLDGFSASVATTTEDGGREVVFGPCDMGGGILVTRKVYVPASGDGFCRWLEIVTNTTAAVTSYSLALQTKMNSDGAASVKASSSGDSIVDATDRYFITDDANGTGDPAVVHTFSGQNGQRPSAIIDSAGEYWLANWNLALNPGETKIVMHVEAQAPNQTGAQARATWLDGQPAALFDGMSDSEIGQLVNYQYGVVTSSTTTALDTTKLGLVLTGTEDINGTGNDRANALLGNSGDNSLSGLSGDDTLFGLAGDDTLSGYIGDDSLNGGLGADSLVGGIGDDVVWGVDGNDIIVGDGAAGTVQTKTGTGTIPSTNQSLSINLSLPDISPTGAVRATGLVSRSVVPTDKYNIAYIIDVSGSMGNPFAGASVGDLNGDGTPNTRLDSAIASFNALTASLLNAGLEGSKVCLIAFNNQGATRYTGTVGADTNANGTVDVRDALQTLTASDETNYQAGLDLAATFFNGQPSGDNNYVFFVSDGYPTQGSYDSSVQNLLNQNGINATIRAIPLGADSSLTDLDMVDDYLANNSVQQILDPSALTAGLVASPVTQAEVDHVEIWVNGTLYETILSANLVSTPFGLQYSVNLSGLPSGENEIEAKVIATDNASTTVSVTEDVTVGGGGADTLYGGVGNDTLTGGAGDDSISGGAGTDKAIFSGLSSDYIFDFLADGTITVTGPDGADSLTGIEQVQFGPDTPLVDINTLLPTKLSLSANQAAAAEGTGGKPTAFTFTVLRQGNTTGESTVGWAVSGSGTNQADAADFAGGALPSGSLTFAAGETSKTITVNVEADGTAELAEGFTVTLTNPSGASLLVDTAGSVIKNDDSFDQTELDDTWVGRNDEDDIASGLAGDDTLTGLAGTDTLYGNSGDDSLSGGTGADSLLGGYGDDVLWGGNNGDRLSGDGGETSQVDTSSNSITIPSTGQSLAININLPDTSNTGTVTATGLVSRSEVTSNEYNIAYIIDVSGSMGSAFSGSISVPDMNGNGYSNELVDGAIASYQALTNSLVSSGLGSSRVALIPFASSSSTPYNGTLTGDANTNGRPDVVDSLLTLNASGSTNYQAALDQAVAFFNTMTSGKNYVFFISDGYPDSATAFISARDQLLSTSGINATIKAIGLGNGADLTVLDSLDDATSNNSAQRVLDPTALTAGLVASPVTQSEIDRLEIYVNGVLYQTLPPSSLVSTPFGLQYSVDLSGLPDGVNDVVAKVVATDEAATSVSVSEDVTVGSEGSDKLYGGDGNDTLLGDNGDDILDGGQGTDVADYSGQMEALKLDLSALTPVDTGTAGTDLLLGIENVFGGSGNDSITGSGVANSMLGNAGDDLLSGLAGDDAMNGGGGDDTLLGGDGNDMINGFNGNDSMDGGDGVDTVNYAWAAGAVSVNLDTTGAQSTGGPGIDGLRNIENVLGGSGGDTIQGSSVDNSLVGNAGNDSLSGGSGDDTLEGGAGNDTMNGGLGDDVATYAAASAAVNVNLAAATAQNTGGAGTDLLSNVPHLIGSNFNDTLAGSTASNRLQGGAGNDSLSGGSGGDTLYGDAGNDTLAGGAGSDTADYSSAAEGVSVNLDATMVQNTLGAGFDLLSGLENLVGGSYADTLTGTAEGNVISGGLGADLIYGEAGTDTASYTRASSGVTVFLGAGVNKGEAAGDTLVGVENLLGSAYEDSLSGDSASNMLAGGVGDDTLASLGGADTLNGGEGDDLLLANAGAESLVGGAGRDTVSYSGAAAAVTANLSGAAGAGWALGDHFSGIDNLVGSNYNDSLSGTTAANRIAGGAGNDTMSGLGGTDTMEGGGGNDVLLAGAQGELLNGGIGVDAVSYALATAGVQAYLAGNAQNTGYATGDLYTDVENLVGSAYADSLFGDSEANSIQGGVGNDLLAGGAGNDSLNGMTGIDTAWYGGATAAVRVSLAIAAAQATGGAGSDLLSNIENLTGSVFNDTLTGDVNANVLSGGLGADSLVGGEGVDIVSYADASSGAYVLLAGGANAGAAAGDTFSGIENVLGGDFNDTLYGSSTVNKLEGGAGDDLMNDGVGNDTIDGGSGNDTLSYEGIVQAFSVNLSLTGPQNTLYGNDVILNIENIIGSTGNDTFNGSAADNIIRGGVGSDRMDGGGGIDTVSYEGAAAAVGVSLAVTSQQNTGGAGIDVLVNFENLIGGGFNDTLIGSTGDNLIIGGAGADSINGNSGADTVSYSSSAAAVSAKLTGGSTGGDAAGDLLVNVENLTGSAFNDSLTGSTANNVLLGGLGNDTLIGGGGDDTLSGGAGIDYVSFASASAGVEAHLGGGGGVGEAAGDVFLSIENMNGSAYGDVLVGDGGANLFLGWGGDDLLVGAAGNDSLTGGTGANVLLGGMGNDLLTMSGDDLGFGGSGNDSLNAGATTSVLAGGLGADNLSVAAGAKVILYNLGDGTDVLNSTDSVQDDTLSLGGGLTRDDLSLSRVGENLVLHCGDSGSVTFTGWYADSPRQGILSLQLIEEAAADYNSGSADPLLNSSVLRFDFATVVSEFNAAMYLDPTLTNWSIGANLAGHLVQATNTAAVGGDFATEYGVNGGFGSIGQSGAQAIQSSAAYCKSAQTLQDSSTLSEGGMMLAG